MKSVRAKIMSDSTKANALKRDSGLGGMLIIFQVSEVFGTAYDSGQKLYPLT